jgi:hypothetical protein
MKQCTKLKCGAMRRKWAVRVVLASPGDVAEEREAVERAVARINLLLKASDAP